MGLKFDKRERRKLRADKWWHSAYLMVMLMKARGERA